MITKNDFKRGLEAMASSLTQSKKRKIRALENELQDEIEENENSEQNHINHQDQNPTIITQASPNNTQVGAEITNDNSQELPIREDWKTYKPSFATKEFLDGFPVLWKYWKDNGIDKIIELRKRSVQWRQGWTYGENKRFSIAKYFIEQIKIKAEGMEHRIPEIIEKMERDRAGKKLSTIYAHWKKQEKVDELKI